MPTESSAVIMGVGGGDEAFEEGMRLVRFAVEFRVKLAGDKEGMIGQFNDFDQSTVRSKAAEDELGLLEAIAVSIIELVTVAMAFFDNERAVEPGCFSSDHELAGLSPESHRSALLGDLGLLVEHSDHRVRCIGVKFG